jgi:hypothetical protein
MPPCDYGLHRRNAATRFGGAGNSTRRLTAQAEDVSSRRRCERVRRASDWRQTMMSADFRELVKRAGNYAFDATQLDALAISGTLRKASDPRNCLLIVSSTPAGDLVVEVPVDDVVGHEVGKEAGSSERVTLHVKSDAVVAASIRGRMANALVPGFVVASAFGQGVREPIPSVSWRDVVTPFSRLDVMLNLIDGLAWTECRARGKAECEALHPPGADRDRCISDKYIECGPPPRLRVDERVLEQLVELFRSPVRS